MGGATSTTISRATSVESIASRHDSNASSVSGSGHVTPKRLTSAGQVAVMRHLRHKCQFTKDCLEALLFQFDRLTPGPANKPHEMTRLRFMHLLAENGFAAQDKGVLGSVFDAFDENGNGTISFSEMAIGLAAFLVGTSKTTEELIPSVFRVFDISKDGFISKEEMVRVLDACNALSPIDRFDLSCTEAPSLTHIPSTYGRIMTYVNYVFKRVETTGWALTRPGQDEGRDEQLDPKQFYKASTLFPTIVQGVSSALRVVFRRIFVESTPGPDPSRQPTAISTAGSRMLEVRNPSDPENVPMFARMLHDNLAAIEEEQRKKAPTVKRRPIAVASSS